MAEGRTTYWGKDAAWWRRERIVILGDEFGAEGPAVIDWLSCEADSQRDRGRVRTGVRAVAKGAFITTTARAEQIIRRAVELGALDDYQDEGFTFTVRVSGWEKDQKRAAAAERQANKRARDSALSRSVTPSHAPSHDVHHDRDDTQTMVRGAHTSLADADNNDNSPDPTKTGDTQDTHNPGALSRSVTPSHAPSQPVTKSHPDQTRPLTSKAPPTPPQAGGTGRRRDREREQREYDQRLDAFLLAHPCSDISTEQDEWQKVLAQLDGGLALSLDGSHPHADAAGGTLLIGVIPDYLGTLTARSRRNSRWLDTLTGGRRVEFLACPSLERSAA